MQVISTGMITLPSQVEKAIDDARALPDDDYQTQALEKMVEALDRVLDWERTAKNELDQIKVADRRFTDRSGAEQVRTEVLVYERSLDRTTRVLKDVSKMAINDKMVSLGKAQTELIIRIMMTVITEMRLDPNDTDKARALLLTTFQREANLAPRVEAHVTNELEAAPTIVPGFMWDSERENNTVIKVQGREVHLG